MVYDVFVLVHVFLRLRGIPLECQFNQILMISHALPEIPGGNVQLLQPINITLRNRISLPLVLLVAYKGSSIRVLLENWEIDALNTKCCAFHRNIFSMLFLP